MKNRNRTYSLKCCGVKPEYLWAKSIRNHKNTVSSNVWGNKTPMNEIWILKTANFIQSRCINNLLIKLKNRVFG